MELENKRLPLIDNSAYVLTMDYTIKMLNIHERFVSLQLPVLQYSVQWNPLFNGHPSIADTRDKMDNSENPDWLPLTSMLKQPLNSRHPATLYNGQLSWSQSILNDLI